MGKSKEKKNRSLEGEDESADAEMFPNVANKISRLEPEVIGLEQSENETPEVIDSTEYDSTEKKAESYRHFRYKHTTKKNIRKNEKREFLRWLRSPEALIGMEDRLKGIKVNMEALEATPSTDNARNIPPHNMEASEAEMAYPLDRIILKGEWYYLQDIFEIVHGGSELSPDVYPRFVCNRVHKLKNAKDESSSRRIAGILSYITHLIRFKNRYSMNEDDMSSAWRHKLPSIFSTKFDIMFASTMDDWFPDEDYTMFDSTTGKWITVEKLNLLLSYVLVLSLFVDDFHSDPSDIAWDLRMNCQTLRNHYVYLGCKFVRKNQLMVATLPVPLEFQTIKMKRGKERRKRCE